jgi:hypothetical protein
MSEAFAVVRTPFIYRKDNKEILRFSAKGEIFVRGEKIFGPDKDLIDIAEIESGVPSVSLTENIQRLETLKQRIAEQISDRKSELGRLEKLFGTPPLAAAAAAVVAVAAKESPPIAVDDVSGKILDIFNSDPSKRHSTTQIKNALAKKRCIVNRVVISNIVRGFVRSGAVKRGRRNGLFVYSVEATQGIKKQRGTVTQKQIVLGVLKQVSPLALRLRDFENIKEVWGIPYPSLKSLLKSLATSGQITRKRDADGLNVYSSLSTK